MKQRGKNNWSPIPEGVPLLSAAESRLGWMSMKTRRDYFAGIILFKTLHGHGLYFLSNQIIYTYKQHNYNTRAASNNVLVLP